MTTYTKGEREFLEAMVIKARPDIPLVEIDAPESELLSKCTEFLRRSINKILI